MSRTKITAIILVPVSSPESNGIFPPIPFRDNFILSRLIETFLKVHVMDILLVLSDRMIEFSQPKWEGVRCVFSESDRCQTISSVRSGLTALNSDCEAFFISSIEAPLIRRTTIQDIIQIYELSGRGVIIPSFLGRKGFPILISAKHVEKVLNWNGIGDLKDYLGQDEFDTFEIAVADENILSDVSPSEGVNVWTDKLKNYDIPSSLECFALLTEKFGAGRELLAHSQTVANLAVKMALALNTRGYRLDMRLVEAAGLLHDMARGKQNHASVAASFLRDMDFSRVAEVVEAHMDPMVLGEGPVNERDVVCFADKLVQKDRIVPLEVRFQRQLDRHADDPAGKAAIEKRLSNVRILKSRIEAALGEPIERIVSELVV
ncbi:MAG: HD domain-containing protein [Deltaproteobacteria bacterium]|nr:HD domain-containing protein [Deltaproteobacteria bacterium]